MVGRTDRGLRVGRDQRRCDVLPWHPSVTQTNPSVGVTATGATFIVPVLFRSPLRVPCRLGGTGRPPDGGTSRAGLRASMIGLTFAMWRFHSKRFRSGRSGTARAPAIAD